MQDDELDRFVSLLKGLLKLKAGQCDSIGDELRDHLESRVEELTEQGQSREAAIRTALEEFGDSARLAHAFVVVERHNQRRRFMRMASFSVLGVTIAGLFAGLFISMGNHGGSINNRAIGQTPSETPSAKQSHTISRVSWSNDANPELTAKLEQIDSIEYNDTPFGEVIKDLAEKWNVQFYIHHSLEGGETTLETPITLTLKDVTLKTVLQLLLDSKDLDFQIKNGMVVIATKEEVNRHLEVRVYDVDDLLGLASSFGPNSTHKTGGSNVVKAQGKEGDATKVSNEKTASAESRVAGKTPLTTEDKLISVITSIVAPDTWGENDRGGLGAIEVFGGLLIVTNTHEVHEKIEELLTNMRKAVRDRKE